MSVCVCVHLCVFVCVYVRISECACVRNPEVKKVVVIQPSMAAKICNPEFHSEAFVFDNSDDASLRFDVLCHSDIHTGARLYASGTLQLSETGQFKIPLTARFSDGTVEVFIRKQAHVQSRSTPFAGAADSAIATEPTINPTEAAERHEVEHQRQAEHQRQEHLQEEKRQRKALGLGDHFRVPDLHPADSEPPRASATGSRQYLREPPSLASHPQFRDSGHFSFEQLGATDDKPMSGAASEEQWQWALGAAEAVGAANDQPTSGAASEPLGASGTMGAANAELVSNARLSFNLGNLNLWSEERAPMERAPTASERAQKACEVLESLLDFGAASDGLVATVPLAMMASTGINCRAARRIGCSS